MVNRKYTFYWWVQAVSLFLVILAGLSCGLRIGEKVSSVQNVEGFSVGCLNKMSEKVDLYLDGRLTVDQVNQLFNCAKTALVIFKDRVRGDTKGEFTPDELRKFIQDVILQDKIINDTLLTQIMRLKTVVIGGPEDRLTVSDIERFIIFLDVLKEEAVFFQPYIYVLNVPEEERKKGVEKSLNTIEQDVQQSIGRVSVFLKNFSNPYQLEDMKTLIREVSFFIDHHNDVSDLDQQMALFGTLKKMIVGGEDSVVQPNEWEDLLIGYSDVISAGVHFLLLKKQDGFISPRGMEYISAMFDSLLNILSLSVKNRQKNPVGESEFMELASRLKQAKLMPEKLRSKSIRNLLLIFFGKIFSPEEEKYGAISLTEGHVEKMRQLVKPWLKIQSFLDHLYSSDSLQEGIADPAKGKSFFTSEEMFLAWESFITRTKLLKPLYREGRKVHLSGYLYRAENKMDFKNLTIYNFYNLISTMLKYGYETNYPESPGMTQAELRKFFIDFNPIGEDMGWLARTDGRALVEGEAEFMAANMLIPSTKGFNQDWSQEEYLTSNEIVEYIAYAFSFGFSLKEVNEAVWKACGEKEEDASADFIPEDSYYPVECVRKNLFSILKGQMYNMPDLQKNMMEMDEGQQNGLVEALIHISFETKWEYEHVTYLTKSHLKNIVMAVYFVETTINRYDLNGDSVLDNEEIWLGYPVFKGYLSRVLIHLLCWDDDDLAPSVYAYVIEKEELPSGKEMEWYDLVFAWGKLHTHSLLKGQVNMDLWDLYLDRGKLTRVFSSIVKGFLGKKRERASKTCADDETANGEAGERKESNLDRRRRWRHGIRQQQ